MKESFLRLCNLHIEEKFFKLLSNTLSDRDFEVLMDTGASYTRLKRKVAKENMVEGVMSELDLMAKESSDFVIDKTVPRETKEKITITIKYLMKSFLFKVL